MLGKKKLRKLALISLLSEKTCVLSDGHRMVVFHTIKTH